MINFDHFLARPEFAEWRAHFAQALARRTNLRRHGDLQHWLASLQKMPEIKASVINLDCDAIHIGTAFDMKEAGIEVLEQALQELAPWRKGPYRLFDVYIDSEWRSDWKWQRLRPHISALAGRNVLDVGCGNGYHCWRMSGCGANLVIGIDPSMRFYLQYLAIQKYARETAFEFLPLGIEDMPEDCAIFDTVFSMGVLYHRRQPINHLIELRKLLTDGGELVLETLIVDQAEGGLFRPPGRYAQMRNVWSIMTVAEICRLLHQAGFENVRCVDQSITSLEEQRATPWMQFHSLLQFLDPADQSKTIEGWPAPKRGIFIASKSN